MLNNRVKCLNSLAKVEFVVFYRDIHGMSQIFVVLFKQIYRVLFAPFTEKLVVQSDEISKPEILFA
jgi:hypothetical protein